MIILRTAAGVIVGYVVYAFCSMTLVGAVMGSQSTGTTISSLAALAVIGGIAGALTALIAGPKSGLAVAITAGLVTLATVANLALQLGAEPVWFKLGTLLLTVPALLLVGRRLAPRSS